LGLVILKQSTVTCCCTEYCSDLDVLL